MTQIKAFVLILLAVGLMFSAGSPCGASNSVSHNDSSQNIQVAFTAPPDKLSQAIMDDDVKTVELFIKRNPKLLDEKYYSSIQHRYDSLIDQAAFYQALKVIKMLHDRGVNIDLSDSNGETPLKTAIFMRNIEEVKLLVKLGADVNHRGKNGNTPIFYTVELVDNDEQLEIIRYLKSKGAQINVRRKATFDPNEDTTPLLNAIDFDLYKTTKLFIELGANVNMKSKKGSNSAGSCEKEEEQENHRSVDKKRGKINHFLLLLPGGGDDNCDDDIHL